MESIKRTIALTKVVNNLLSVLVDKDIINGEEIENILEPFKALLDESEGE